MMRCTSLRKNRNLYRVYVFCATTTIYKITIFFYTLLINNSDFIIFTFNFYIMIFQCSICQHNASCNDGHLRDKSRGNIPCKSVIDSRQQCTTATVMHRREIEDGKHTFCCQATVMKFTKRRVLRSLLYAYVLRSFRSPDHYREYGNAKCTYARECSTIDGASGDRFHFRPAYISEQS